MPKQTNANIKIIALISDIHGNFPALKSVYADAVEKGAEVFINAGDSVGYGPYPNETINFLDQHSITTVIGDYDKKVLKYPKKKKKWANKKHPYKIITFQWTFNKLKKKSLQYLQNLPISLPLEFNQKKIFLTHGSPLKIKEHITDKTPPSDLDRFVQIARSEIIVTGNTHTYWTKKWKDSLFINPGSVGRQDDGIPAASYVLINLELQPVITHRRVPYKVEKVLDKIRKEKLPKAFEVMFKNGVNLDKALEIKE